MPTMNETVNHGETADNDVSENDYNSTQLYHFKRRQKPFLPSSAVHEYEDVFNKPKEKTDNSLKYSERKVGQGLVDAETGEAIQLSRATWNKREGRLDLKTSVIIAMGTGKLDIANRKLENAGATPNVKHRKGSSASDGTTSLPPINPSSPHQSNVSGNSSAKSVSSSGGRKRANLPRKLRDGGDSLSMHSDASSSHASDDASSQQPQPAPVRHPLITQYLREGPLNPRCHVRWDRRSDSVLVTNRAERRAMAEEDVEYSDWGDDDEEDDAADEELEGEGGGAEGSQLASYMSSMGTAGSAAGGATVGTPMSQPRVGSPIGSFSPPRSPSPGGTESVAGASRQSMAKQSILQAANASLDAMVGSTLGMQNVYNWQAVEEKFFQELYALAWQYEKNKSLTGEKKAAKGMLEVRATCRALARLKTKGMKELVVAIADEKKKEEKRKALEMENAERLTYLVELMKTHNEQRKKSRQYLHALEHDNEIIFINKLGEAGYLW